MQVLVDHGVLWVAEVDVDVKSVLPFLGEERVSVEELELCVLREVDTLSIYEK